jgi:triacylglycerol lipase
VRLLATKYPIVLVHGIVIKQMKIINAFGQIGNQLLAEGYPSFVADIDAIGSVDTNAEQLKRYIERVLAESGAEKVNIIAHSKGGLDSKFMITELGMEDKVASLTTLCTPHKGSLIASKIWDLPSPIKRFIAFWIDAFYRIVFRDEHPNSLRACEQLRLTDEVHDTLKFSQRVYCQSYSTNISSMKDCFIMALPMKMQHYYEVQLNDGLVSKESSEFGCYHGNALDIPVSHVQITDLFSKKNQKAQIYDFYTKICRDLEDMGF